MFNKLLSETEVEVKTSAAALTSAANQSIKSFLETAQKVGDALQREIKSRLEANVTLKAQATQGRAINRKESAAEIKKFKR